LPIGGFDKAYFEGATNILALACRINFPPCANNATAPQAEPVAPPAATASAPAAAVAKDGGSVTSASNAFTILLPFIVALVFLVLL
jgi:hypothetical protein